MIVFLHQLKSRDNGPVLLFEILAIIVGIDNAPSSCLLLLNRLTQQRVMSNAQDQEDYFNLVPSFCTIVTNY